MTGSLRQGGCGCGAVRYEIEGEPVVLAVCHCRECQRQSGSAFGMSLIVKKEAFRISGETRVYRRVADSGNPIDCHFCPTCGVRVFHDPQALPGTYNVKAGTLDDTAWLAPAVQVWTKSRQPWVTLPEGLASVEGQP